MGKVIRIGDLSGIYAAGVKNFAENLLKSKAEKGESVVYSIGGQIIKLNASDALWVYERLSGGLSAKEIEILTERADKGEDMQYWLTDGNTLAVPARLVLDLFDRLLEDKG